MTFDFSATYPAGMSKAAPACYLYNAGVRKESGNHVRIFGTHALMIHGKLGLEAMGSNFLNSFSKAGVTLEKYLFDSEVCEKELENICKTATNNVQMVIGVGGGKVMDIAKLAAHALHVPVVCMPTIAATCAAVTPMSVLYHEDGTYRQDVFFPQNPNMVIADPEVIGAAPVEYLKAGILDSIAKWYEGSASIKGCAEIADIFDVGALRMAGMLFEEMMANVQEAIDSAVTGTLSAPLMSVIHLNIYFAGLIQSMGIKAVRNGIAHSVHNGLTVLPESHALLHGLKVGYGIYVQLMVLREQENLLEQARRFFEHLQFIPSFRALGLPYSREIVRKVAHKIHADPMMKKIPFHTITEDDLVAAMQRIEAAHQETLQ